MDTHWKYLPMLCFWNFSKSNLWKKKLQSFLYRCHFPMTEKIGWSRNCFKSTHSIIIRSRSPLFVIYIFMFYIHNIFYLSLLLQANNEIIALKDFDIPRDSRQANLICGRLLLTDLHLSAMCTQTSVILHQEAHFNNCFKGAKVYRVHSQRVSYLL